MNSIFSIFKSFFSLRATNIQQILDCISSQKNAIITFLNPFTLLYMRKHHSIYKEFDYICSDAISPVIFEQFFGFKSKRISFDLGSFAQPLFEYAEKNNKKIFLCGSSSEILACTVIRVKKLFPQLQIVGTHHGFFSENNGVISTIKSLKPDIVILGLGVPKQDIMALELKKANYIGAVFTCGGFLHQTALSHNGYYYPPIINRLNLRALYRLFREKYVLKRLLVYYIPFFLLYFLFLTYLRFKSIYKLFSRKQNV